MKADQIHRLLASAAKFYRGGGRPSEKRGSATLEIFLLPMESLMGASPRPNYAN